MSRVQLVLPLVDGRVPDLHWTVDRPLTRIPCGPIALRLSSDETVAEAALRCVRCKAQRTVERTIWSHDSTVWYSNEQPGDCIPPFGGELVEPVADCARTNPFGCGDLFWLHDLSSAFSALLERVRREAEPEAALACLDFHESVRKTIYAAIVCDRRGYVRQLVDQHPGIALLAATTEPFLLHTPPTGLWGPAWQAVADGRPLQEVGSHIAAALRLGLPVAHRLHWLARRVHGSIDPSALIAAAHCLEAPQSDLPTTPEHRHLWINALAAVHANITDTERAEPWAIAATRYVSAHYTRFVSLPAGELFRLVGGLHARGRQVSRRVPFERLMEDQERWWERWTTMEDAKQAVEEFRRRGVLKLPPPPVPGIASVDFSVEPITTPERLYLEGERMGHCIFSYCPTVLDGYAAVYSVRCDGEPSTVLLERLPGSAWRVREHRGRHNRVPAAHEIAAVHKWLTTVEAAKGAARVRPEQDGS